jgi:hypothetical protein
MMPPGNVVNSNIAYFDSIMLMLLISTCFSELVMAGLHVHGRAGVLVPQERMPVQQTLFQVAGA